MPVTRVRSLPVVQSCRLAVVARVCLLAVSASLLTVLTSPATVPATAAAAPVTTVSNDALLGLLPVRPEVTVPAYVRTSFRHWVDADGDCQDTRVEVLVRDDRSGTSRGCRVRTGRWVSWLDGRTATSSRTLDVDHLVALGEAWDSGASVWDASRRESFANDLGFVWSLQAVSSSVNRSKSDRDPAEWLPSGQVRCVYVSRWMQVKYRWGLAVDPVERAALAGVLAGPCGGESVVLPPVVPGGPATEDAPPAPLAPLPGNVSAGGAAPSVRPGAFCSPLGATGSSFSGGTYVCAPGDGDERNRWRPR